VPTLISNPSVVGRIAHPYFTVDRAISRKASATCAAVGHSTRLSGATDQLIHRPLHRQAGTLDLVVLTPLRGWEESVDTCRHVYGPDIGQDA
jgi:hypothetical protein